MSTVILVITAVCACVITALFGAVLIPFLRKLHFGQTILEIGPKWHEKKQGTPIMGGIMFIVGTLIATSLMSRKWRLGTPIPVRCASN